MDLLKRQVAAVGENNISLLKNCGKGENEKNFFNREKGKIVVNRECTGLSTGKTRLVHMSVQDVFADILNFSFQGGVVGNKLPDSRDGIENRGMVSSGEEPAYLCKRSVSKLSYEQHAYLPRDEDFAFSLLSPDQSGVDGKGFRNGTSYSAGVEVSCSSAEKFAEKASYKISGNGDVLYL